MVRQFEKTSKVWNQRQHSLPLVMVSLIYLSFGTVLYGQAPPFRPTGQFATGRIPGSFFAQQIAVVGDVVAVNVRDDGTFAPRAGAVNLYSSEGVLFRTIYSPNSQEDGQFGSYLAGVGANKLVVSANKEDGRQGNAYLFDVRGDFIKSLLPKNITEGEEFGGRSVVANDTSLFVGSWLERGVGDSGEFFEGAVYRYDHDGELLARFSQPRIDETRENCLGRSAAFVGIDKIVVGDACSWGLQNVESAGAAFLFDFDGNVLQAFDNPRPASLDSFGSSVAFAAGRILIGGVQIDDLDTGASTGAAYIYEVDGTLVTRVSDPEPHGGNWFGWNAGSMTLESGEEVFIIGSIFNSTTFSRAGKLFIVNRDGDIIQVLESPTPGTGEQFGVSFAQFGEKLLVGETQDGGGFPNGTGAVWVFEPADLGDMNLDGSVDAVDLDTLCSELVSGEVTESWEITGDDIVDAEDLTRFLELTDRLPGDADFDGQVSFADFLTLSVNFGNSKPTTWSDGNFNCSGHVGFDDFLLLSTNFGQSQAAQSVPEPRSMGLFALLIVVLSTRGSLRPPCLCVSKTRLPDKQEDADCSEPDHTKTLRCEGICIDGSCFLSGFPCAVESIQQNPLRSWW